MLSKLINNVRVRNFLLGSPAVGRVLHSASDKYLRKFSMVDVRYFRWLYCLERTRHLQGDIVELGIGPGRFLTYSVTWMQQTKAEKRYYGYDTFAGFPSVTDEDKEGLRPGRLKRVAPGKYAFSRDRIERVVRHLGAKDQVQLVQGDFVQTLQQVRPDKISFLYIDCDLYEGYKAGLELLYDRVTPGGLILFDEYEHVDEWPGARKAVDEFFADKPEEPQPLPFSASHFVVRGETKPREAEVEQTLE